MFANLPRHPIMGAALCLAVLFLVGKSTASIFVGRFLNRWNPFSVLLPVCACPTLPAERRGNPLFSFTHVFDSLCHVLRAGM